MKIFTLLLIGALVASAGCETANRATPASGALGGGAAGATAGGIIGHQKGKGLEGAAIGGAIGALSGAVFGLDRQAKQQNPNHLTLTRIAEMSQQGVPDDEIINEIQRTKSTYALSSETITYLKNNKVSDRVINYMLETAPR